MNKDACRIQEPLSQFVPKLSQNIISRNSLWTPGGSVCKGRGDRGREMNGEYNPFEHTVHTWIHLGDDCTSQAGTRTLSAYNWGREMKTKNSLYHIWISKVFVLLQVPDLLHSLFKHCHLKMQLIRCILTACVRVGWPRTLHWAQRGSRVGSPMGSPWHCAPHIFSPLEPLQCSSLFFLRLRKQILYFPSYHC